MSDEQLAPYRVEVASPARHEMSSLPGSVVHAIIEFISGPLAEDPQKLSTPLSDQLEGLFSARSGNYCILLRVDEEQLTIVIVDIEHRSRLRRN